MVSLGTRRLLAAIAAVGIIGSMSDEAWAGNRRRGRGGGGTAASAQLKGEARLRAASAQAGAMRAQAAINLEEAKATEIRNRLLWEKARVAEAIANQREARAHDASGAARVAHSSGPARLTAEEFDPAAGTLRYPLILSDHRYDDVRAEVDRHLADRAAGEGRDASDDRAVLTLVDRFRDELRSHVDDYPAADYGHAAMFLERLRTEIRSPAER